MSQETSDRQVVGRRLDRLVGPDVPVLFRVDFYEKESIWGIARPTDKEDHGRGITMLTGEGFGWWYPEKSLEESVRNLFRHGEVSGISRASVVME